MANMAILTSRQLCTGGLSVVTGVFLTMARGRPGYQPPAGWRIDAAGCIDAPEYMPAGSLRAPWEPGDSPTWTTRE